MLIEFKTDAETVGDLMQTLSALVVKDELCQKVEASGGLLFVHDVLKEFGDNEVSKGSVVIKVQLLDYLAKGAKLSLTVP